MYLWLARVLSASNPADWPSRSDASGLEAEWNLHSLSDVFVRNLLAQWKWGLSRVQCNQSLYVMLQTRYVDSCMLIFRFLDVRGAVDLREQIQGQP